jgi:hypothetical protein
MAWARCSVQPLAQARDFDEGAGALGIHLLGRGRKDQVNTRCVEYPAILLQAPGIGGKVFFGSELGWVHKDGNRDRIAAGLRSAHQGEMALV